MPWIVVDVEADGPIPGDYSMIALAAVVVSPALDTTFKAYLRPISGRWDPEALAISGFSRERTLEFEEPESAMPRFAEWVEAQIRPRSPARFLSDNNGFDWQFANWYLHRFAGRNPFGFSSANLGSLYRGLRGDLFASFKHLRRTPHTHDPLDDAMGNAEAFLAMIRTWNPRGSGIDPDEIDPERVGVEPRPPIG